ncbi:sensor domain-containing protein [Mycobacterium sp. E2497]|uniref:sensor domain-containing protein n=1 Tax=Mycobacterium sp. E2497 TaxID=1834135 RepID=UPI0007FF921E|nr:sensor domain-containing protein [Mycobacterium sp. E2497]OBI23594.1 hypothetical protein A5713_09140 [Mycobacterium sp. E2497]
MPLFISYSSQDRATVDALTTALRRGQQQVWFDQELGGGESWWHKILEQIRSCDVFIVALSNNWLQSKPSQAELRYARALNRPILPVRIGDIDSMRVNPLASLQIIDYREPTVDAGIQLVTAVHALQSKPVPLPDPLPDEPPVPFGYITRLGNTLAEKELSPQQQTQLLIELRQGLDEDGDDPSARGDIGQLLRMLRLRHDVTYRTRTEIDNVLSEIEAKDGSPAAAATQKAQAPASGPPQPDAAAPTSGPSKAAAPAPVATGVGGGSSKRLMIIGGAAAAVIAVIAIVVVMATQGGKTKPTPTTTTGAPTAAAPSAPTAGNVPNLDAYLLGPADVSAVVGEPNLVVSDKTDAIRAPRWTLSNPDCLGAYEPIPESAYKASGYTAVAGQAVHSPGQDPAHRVFEAVVAFPSADKAAAFVQASADKWKACAGQSVTVTATNGKTTGWKFDDVDGTPPKIFQERTQTEGTRNCHHALHAVSTMVVDLLLCGPDPDSGQAGKLAGQIAAKVSQ